MSSNIFTKESKVARSAVKRAFLEIVDYKCVLCYNEGIHNGQKLTLQLDHINWDRYDNRIENLRLLCPNCHSQQKTSNKQKGEKKINKITITEEKVLDLARQLPSIRQILLKLHVADSSLNYEKIRKILKLNNLELDKNLKIEYKTDRNRPRPQHRKVERPSKDQLEKLVWEESTVKLSKKFGVSDKAIEKWCKFYGINKPPRGYWAKKYSGL